MEVIKLTADMEEPNCERCTNRSAGEDYCYEHCGPEYFWCGYERIVSIDNILEDDEIFGDWNPQQG